MQQGIVRILIIDDDEDDYLITSDYIRHIPGAAFQIDWCPAYDKALSLMLDKSYDLYFTDYRLGAHSGVDLLKEASARGADVPIILLTGKGNREVDLEAMQLGAVDYLVKTELTVEKMERCIRYTMERMTHLRALKANERKYRSVFEKSKDFIFITDDMLDFQDVNEAGTTLFGYEPEELLQMNLCDLIDQAQHKKYLLNALESRKMVGDWEVTLTAKNGEKKVCILTAAKEEEYNEIEFVQGIIHDITMMRKEERVTLQAEKLAATGRLVRTLAHEVRNPLNNIMLSVEQIVQEKVDEGSELYLNIIQRNAQRISGLINELLNTSRPTEVVPEEKVLQAILDDVVAASIDRITLKKLQLTVNYPEPEVRIMADAEKLKLALLNVVINAVEAMEEGKGLLQLELIALRHTAMLKIADNGCGISEENISRLFEPYFTQKRNGMGLGLAFTLNILQAHKATTDVISGESKGTTFTITFPLAPFFNEETDNGSDSAKTPLPMEEHILNDRDDQLA